MKIGNQILEINARRWGKTAAIAASLPLPGTIIKPTRVKIPVHYYDEIMPGQVITTEVFGIHPLVREGNRAFLIFTLS